MPSLAGAVGIEPTLKVLETFVLPLYDAPIQKGYILEYGEGSVALF